MKKLEQLRQELQECRDEIVRLSELEDITPEDDARLTELTDAFPERQAVVAKEEKREKVAEAARALKAAPAPGDAASDYTPDPLGEPGSVRDNKRIWNLDEVRAEMREAPERAIPQLAARALDAVEHAAGVDARNKQRVTELVESLRLAVDTDDDGEARGAKRVLGHIVATSSPEYMRAWTKALKSMMRTGTADPNAVATLARAASLTDAAGGYAVPLPVDPTLIKNYDVDVNPFRAISTQRMIVTDQLRTVNATAAVFSWDGEAAEASDDTPTWANIDITVHKAQASIPFSIEISQDYAGFTQDIRDLLADGRDDLEAAAFATGSGSSQPIGIVTALTGGSYVYTSTTTDTFAVADLYKVEENLAPQYRARSSWVANKAIYNDVRQFGTSDSHALWERLGAAQPPELLGYPAYESSIMDGTITALSDNYVMVLGDFRNYWIVDRVGLSIELVPHLLATGNNRPNGQRAFYAYWRVGADSVNDRAFAMLNVT